MKPIERAKEIYEQKCEEAIMRGEKHPPFEQLVQEYRKDGIVISNSTCFVMARPIVVHVRGQLRSAWNPRTAVGNLRDMARALPIKLPFIAFGRRGKGLRIYQIDRFLSLVFNLGGLRTSL